MVSMNLHQATAALPSLVEAALNGEKIIIIKDGKPMVRLVPCQERKTPRQPGRLLGQIWIGDDFDAVDAEIIEMFETGM
jgi:antitoxin (DNA-binding transcriptional repressor) of toxin-antitoxin stability system